MKFTIEPDIGLSFLLQAALPQLVTDRETKTHRRGQSKRSYGHCQRRTEIPEAKPLPDTHAATLWRSRPGPAESHIAGTDCFSVKEGYPLHPDHVLHSDRCARCSTDAHMFRPTKYRTSPAQPGLPSTVTLCPLTSGISHIRQISGEYFGNPLVSGTDDHAHQCRLTLWIEHTLLGHERTPSRLQPIPAPGWGIRRRDRSEPLGADRFRQRNHRKVTSVS